MKVSKEGTNLGLFNREKFCKPGVLPNLWSEWPWLPEGDSYNQVAYVSHVNGYYVREKRQMFLQDLRWVEQLWYHTSA